MRNGRRLLATAVLAAAALCATPPAWAYWTVTSSLATGSAMADTLGTPVVEASRSSLLILYRVDFTVGDQPPGLTPTGYHVTFPDGTSVCNISGPDGSCSQSGIGGGAQTFKISAYRGSWTSLTLATCTFSSGASTGSCTPSSYGMQSFAMSSFGAETELVSTPVLDPEPAASATPSVPTVLLQDDSGTSDSDGITQVTSPRLIGTAEPGSNVVLSEGIADLARGSVDGEGNYSIETDLGEGPHAITAASQSATAPSVPSSAASVLIDVTAPQLTVEAAGDGPTRTITGTAGTADGDAGEVMITSDRNGLVDTVAPLQAAGKYSASLEPPTMDTTVTVTQIDSAGNEGSATVKVSGAATTAAPPPTPASNDPTPNESPASSPKPTDTDTTPAESPASENAEPTDGEPIPSEPERVHRHPLARTPRLSSTLRRTQNSGTLQPAQMEPERSNPDDAPAVVSLPLAREPE